VAYAAQRGITIIPEIDMPGHVTAAIAAYPGLGHPRTSCPEVGVQWGVYHNALNLNEDTVQFFLGVLEEIVDIFPSNFIHLGGDECRPFQWQRSMVAQSLKRDLGLTSEAALEGWFLRRMADFLRSHGRRMIGWDEIADRDAPTDAVVMAWRGMDQAERAATLGHDVILTPEDTLYFNRYQSTDLSEPLAFGGLTSWQSVYTFDPLRAGLIRHKTRILGAECALWGEYIPNQVTREYMAFPRMCAFAEVLWNGRGRELPEFQGRLEGHLRRLSALSVNYRALEPESDLAQLEAPSARNAEA
jgi:hexosaminidase